MLDWRRNETILLDMDGTVLDLAFDNYFWRELVPRCLARSRQISLDEVSAELFEHYASKQGSLDWYCLDYWTAQLDLDIRALKTAASQRIRFLPGAREFLATVTGMRKHLVLVTNAHVDTLAVKKGVAGLERYFDLFISSHEVGWAKEQAEFWPLLHASIGFDPATTLFIDDSLAVLDAAADFGIRNIVAVTHPDSGQKGNSSGKHYGVNGIVSLI
jgi:HAD superfamily hydrolase (TIGR01509 family)